MEVLPYRLERFESPEVFIEAAEKRLWSMFKHVSPNNLRIGIEKLKTISEPIRNDELITLVIGWKTKK